MRQVFHGGKLKSPLLLAIALIFNHSALSNTRQVFDGSELKKPLIFGTNPTSDLPIRSACLGTVNWSGAVAADVTDKNIDISANVTLSNNVTIYAQTCDIDVNITSGADTSIEGEYKLRLLTDPDRIINFHISENLSFMGGPTVVLFISVEGSGTVIFTISDNKSVKFTCNPASSCSINSGTYLVVLHNLDSTPSNLEFAREDKNSTNDVFINIGQNSILTYISPNLDTFEFFKIATIMFEPTNQSCGRMVFQVDDKASVMVWPHYTFEAVNPTLSSIIWNRLAGGTSQLSVQNTDINNNAYAGLWIENRNTIYPNLSSNPYCQNGSFGDFTGKQNGFILSSNGAITIKKNAYISYVGLANNSSPVMTAFDQEYAKFHGQIVPQDWNGSALIVDGFLLGTRINNAAILLENAGLFFLSGIDSQGSIGQYSECLPYVINPEFMTKGCGNRVFDIEAPISIGSQLVDTPEGAIEVLSLYENQRGSSLLIDGEETVFPARTYYEDPSGKLYQYNKSYIFVNTYRTSIFNTNIKNTDTLHKVFGPLGPNYLNCQNLAKLPTYNGTLCPDQSEPIYVGGRTYADCSDYKIGAFYSYIQLYNTNVHFHTDAATTGLTWEIPNSRAAGASSIVTKNDSNFIFYSNGRAIDNGTGRIFVLGSNIEPINSSDSASAFEGYLTSVNARLNIEQLIPQSIVSNHILNIRTDVNNYKVNPGISCNIDDQKSIHTVYLVNDSGIGIGKLEEGTPPFPLTTDPTLNISGEFLSFETQGGVANYPELSYVSGVGGIFVDQNGTIQVSDYQRVNFGCMVTRSGNGRINLPSRSVFFDLRVGVANWKPNMTGDEADRILVKADENFTDYTMDWMNVIKDYCECPINYASVYNCVPGSDCDSSVTFTPTVTVTTTCYVPYQVNMADLCDIPVYEMVNLYKLPIFEGQIDQLQIKRSRLGDQAAFFIRGENALVRELVFLTGYNSAEAPMAYVILEDKCSLGLGTASRNVDSVDASVVLGINGVTLIANGTASVSLNTDTIINNICHILKGPDYQSSDRLYISSEVPKELRVKSDGVLDLRSFGSQDKIVIGGRVSLVLEPGARIYLGGATLSFADEAELLVERTPKFTSPGTSVSDTDKVRAKLMGTGTIDFTERALFLVMKSAFLGVETDDCVKETDLTILLEDSGSLQIGSADELGGVFQIGNTTDRSGHKVSLTISMSGYSPKFQLYQQGFFGVGVGIINKSSNIPNNWTIGKLHNVEAFNLEINDGIFALNRTFSGDSSSASLFAFRDLGSSGYQFEYSPSSALIQGGSNIKYFSNDLASESYTPLVLTYEGLLDIPGGGVVGTSIMSSGPILQDYQKSLLTGVSINTSTGQIVFNGSGLDLFNLIRCGDIYNLSFSASSAAKGNTSDTIVGYSVNSLIYRTPIQSILGTLSAVTVDHSSSVMIGAVNLQLKPGTASILSVLQIANG